MLHVKTLFNVRRAWSEEQQKSKAFSHKEHIIAVLTANNELRFAILRPFVFSTIHCSILFSSSIVIQKIAST
jgi:hypothetical protein